MATAVIDTNKMNKLGLRRRPTYEEIIGVIDESNKKSLANCQIEMLHFLRAHQKAVSLMVVMQWNNLGKNKEDYY